MATVLREMVKSIKILLDNCFCVAKFVFYLLKGSFNRNPKMKT